MSQPRLPGTLPTPAEARRAQRKAIDKERDLESKIETLRESLKDLRRALGDARAERRRCDDDLAAIEDGRRP